MVYIWSWSLRGVVTPLMVTARVLVFIVVATFLESVGVATFLESVGVGWGATSGEGAVVGKVLVIEVVVERMRLVNKVSSSLVGGGQAADGR